MIDASSFSFRQHAPDVRERIVGMINCHSELAAVTELATVVELMGFDHRRRLASAAENAPAADAARSTKIGSR